MAALACPCAGVFWKEDLPQLQFRASSKSCFCTWKCNVSLKAKLCTPSRTEAGRWNLQTHGRKPLGGLHMPAICALNSISPEADVRDNEGQTEESGGGKIKQGRTKVGKKPRSKRGSKKSGVVSSGPAVDLDSPLSENQSVSAPPEEGSRNDLAEVQISASEPSHASGIATSEVGAGDAWPREPEVAVVPESSAEGQTSSHDATAAEGPSTSSDSDDPEVEKGYKMSKVCDRLVEIFMVETPDPVEWRKLLIFSEEWSKIRPHFYKRCKELADKEDNFTRKAELLKLGRRLKEVEDDMARHDELMTLIEKNPSELETIVSRRRKDFTSDFFTHLKTLAEASHKNLNRRDEIATLAARCLTLIEVHDATLEDEVSVTAAQEKFDSILASPSLEAATEKINELARNKQLDPTLMLLMTKAWAAAKESSLVKEEAKDIMYHLYTVARGNMARLVPKEVRILRHILSMEDPKERLHALGEAFAPGEETEGDQIDMLYTTPPDLYKWVRAVLDAYYSNRQGTLIKEAAQLMNPMVIHRLEALKVQMEDQYL